MMKDYVKLLAGISLYLSLPLHAADAPLVPTPQSANSLTTSTKIQELLHQEEQNIAAPFPYRMHLFTEGQIAKNNAGLRIAETAKQLLGDESGLLFYYELVNEAMRVPHWHANAMEIGTVLEGKMRVTIWEGTGKAQVFTVEKNGTWIIPKAKLHALENVGAGEMKFLVAYDSPIAADRDFLTAWASLPNAILARAVGLTEQDIASIKKLTINRLSKFDPAGEEQVTDEANALTNNFLTTNPMYESSLGSITRIDSKVNPLMQSMAMQRTIIQPSVLRTPHWYTSGDVLLFVLHGQAFFTMMDDDGKVYHSILRPGDLVFIPIGNFHSLLNIGQEDLEIYEVFNRANDIQEITLRDGVQHFRVGTMEGALGLTKSAIEKIFKDPAEPYMMAF